jgi:hypothetical protein
LALGKKIIIVKNATAYTWDWYCHLVVDRASFHSAESCSDIFKSRNPYRVENKLLLIKPKSFKSNGDVKVPP